MYKMQKNFGQIFEKVRILVKILVRCKNSNYSFIFCRELTSLPSKCRDSRLAKHLANNSSHAICDTYCFLMTDFNSFDIKIDRHLQNAT